MLEILLEHPLAIALCGLASVIVAFFIWLQTAHKAGLVAAIAFLALTVILVWTSISIETERESIEVLLSEIANAVEANDHDRVLSYIHPNALEGERRARAELPRYEFREARITRIKDITVNSGTRPETAIAEFNVVVNVQTGGYDGKAARFLRVYLMKQEGRWLVRDYEHFDVRAGFSNSPLATPPMGN